MSVLSKWSKLLRGNFRLTLNEALIYRSHTVFFLVFETIFFIGNFYTIHIGFDLAGGSINGWTKHESFLVSSIFNFTHQIFLSFFMQFIEDLGEKVGNGSFDFILLKPHTPLLTMWVSTPWVMQNIPSLFLSGGVLSYLMLTSEGVSLASLLACLALILLGVLIRLSLGILCVCPVFFSERLHAVDTYWSLMNLGVYPQSVFPKSMQYFFTFGLPIFLVSSVPAEAFFGMRSKAYLSLSFVLGLLFCFVCFRIFRWSLTHYKSVNAGI